MAVDSVTAAGFAEALEALQFFPSGEIARLMIANEISAMCANRGQAEWLVQKMFRTFGGKWPGPAEMRAAFCSKFRPADGYEVSSTIYPDGIPTDVEQGFVKQISGGPGPKLVPAPVVEKRPVASSQDPELDRAMKVAGGIHKMPPARWSNSDPVSRKLIDMGFDPL